MSYFSPPYLRRGPQRAVHGRAGGGDDIVPVVDPATPPSMILGPKSHVYVTLALLAAQFVIAIVTPVGSRPSFHPFIHS